MRMALSSIIISVAITLAVSASSFGETRITESEQEAIYALLEKLARAMVEEDIDSAMSLFSPNMDKEKRDEIKQTLEKKFSSYDYQKYQFDRPSRGMIKVLEAAEKVEFRTGYSEEYKFKTSGSSSSSGLTSNFTMEKLGREWLILDTDFYSKQNITKWLGILGIIFAVFILAIIISLPFWLWMLIDCVRRDFPKSDEKLIWIIVIVFTQIIGAVIYYFIIKRKTSQSAR